MFQLKILTLKGAIFAGEVDSVNIPTPTGEVGVLTDHEDYISSIVIGEIKISINGVNEIILAKGGFVKIEKNLVHILLDDAVMAKDVIIDRIKESEERARQQMQKSDILSSELMRLEKSLRYEKFKREYSQREGL